MGMGALTLLTGNVFNLGNKKIPFRLLRIVVKK